MQPILTLPNLKQGMQAWENHTGWPSDFHSQLYADLRKLLRDGLTPLAWGQLVDVLWNWKAVRPKSKDYILRRGLESIGAINEQLTILAGLYPSRGTLVDLTWPEITSLFELAREVKGVSSPVFPSKMCHFLLPNAFPVIDNAFIGVKGEYSDYWTQCRNLWIEPNQKTKNALKACLGKHIPQENIANYPWATKIVELCLSGARTA